jgi:hypothetical protein
LAVSTLQGCAVVSSNYELLPTDAYIKRSPIKIQDSSEYEGKIIDANNRHQSVNNSAANNKILNAVAIDVFPNGLRPNKPAILFANIAAWSNVDVGTKVLDAKVVNESKKLGADFVIMLDKGAEVRGSTISSSPALGLSYAENNYTFYRKGIAGVYSKVYAGFFCDKDGFINFIYKNSPAEKALLKEGYKILSINGIYFLQDSFVTDREISTKKAGDIINIEYLDKTGNKQVTELRLEKVVD